MIVIFLKYSGRFELLTLLSITEEIYSLYFGCCKLISLLLFNSFDKFSFASSFSLLTFSNSSLFNFWQNMHSKILLYKTSFCPFLFI